MMSWEEEELMMRREELAIGSTTMPPVLFHGGSYSAWKGRFLSFISIQELGEEILKSIQEGPAVIMMDVDGDLTIDPPILPTRVVKHPVLYSDAEKKRVKADELARGYLILGLTNEIYLSIDGYETAKAMWDELYMRMRATDMGARRKVDHALTSYEGFKAKKGESLESTYHRFCHLLKELRENNIHKTNMEVNIKFLTNLRLEWEWFANNIFQNEDLSELSIHVVYGYLSRNQEKIQEITRAQQDKRATNPLVKLRQTSRRSKKKAVVQSSSSANDSSDSDSSLDMQELKKTITLITKAIHKKSSSSSNKLGTYSRSMGKDKAKAERSEHKNFENKLAHEVQKCYNCGKSGHFATECRQTVKKNSHYYMRKAMLAKQKEAGQALMAEDVRWLELTDDEDEQSDG